MNHKPRKWSAEAMVREFQSTRDLLPKQRLSKWPAGECVVSLTDKQRRFVARHNAAMSASAMRIPRKTQMRLARAMMVHSRNHPN